MSSFKETPEITGYLSHCQKFKFNERQYYLVGIIRGDTRERFPDGRVVYTSTVKKIEGDLAYTQNSVYRIESWLDE